MQSFISYSKDYRSLWCVFVNFTSSILMCLICFHLGVTFVMQQSAKMLVYTLLAFFQTAMLCIWSLVPCAGLYYRRNTKKLKHWTKEFYSNTCLPMYLLMKYIMRSTNFRDNTDKAHSPRWSYGSLARCWSFKKVFCCKRM